MSLCSSTPSRFKHYGADELLAVSPLSLQRATRSPKPRAHHGSSATVNTGSVLTITARCSSSTSVSSVHSRPLSRSWTLRREKLLAPIQECAALLTTMPGVSDIVAQIIVAESGVDISRLRPPATWFPGQAFAAGLPKRSQLLGDLDHHLLLTHGGTSLREPDLLRAAHQHFSLHRRCLRNRGALLRMGSTPTETG
jgi:hypothetical protein